MPHLDTNITLRCNRDELREFRGYCAATGRKYQDYIRELMNNAAKQPLVRDKPSRGHLNIEEYDEFIMGMMA